MSLPGRRADGVALRLLLQRAARKKENGVLSVPPVWAARQSAVLLAGCRGREAAGARVRPRPPHSLLFFAVLPGAALCGAACAHIRLRPWHLPPYCLPVGMAFAYRGGNGAPQCCLPLPGDLCFVRPQKAHRRHSVVLTARRPTAHLPPQKQRVTGPKIPCEKEKTQVVFFFFDFWEILTFIKTFCY